VRYSSQKEAPHLERLHEKQDPCIKAWYQSLVLKPFTKDSKEQKEVLTSRLERMILSKLKQTDHT